MTKTESRSYLVSKRHPPEYLLHKYWARKPHNILAHLVRRFVPQNGLVLDPFCGSGVFLVEAIAAGRRAIGIDLNPVSVLLSRVSTNPPESEAFQDAASELVNKARERFGSSYQVNLDRGSKTVRFVVHAVLAPCDGCDTLVSAADAVKRGNRYRCPECDDVLHFNLEHLESTEVVGLTFTDGTQIEIGQESQSSFGPLQRQQQAAYESLPRDTDLFDQFDAPFLSNRRILAFPDMSVRDLFTPRAFRVACTLATWIKQIDDVQTRDAVLLYFTSSVAQFSRLIAWRNNLTTGGPAWTVPGFWVPPIHLESNPILHLEARLNRYERGLRRLRKRIGERSNDCQVYLGSAQHNIDALAGEDVRFDAVFLDPPYGDSVPYLEFSSMWNAFLGQAPHYDHEIIVSDRTEKRSSWHEYQQRLTEVFAKCSAVLRPDGCVLVTFNNLEPQAWYALLKALYAAGLWCQDAWYQVPAVVSAKAQFNPKSSFIGDFYCIFKPNASTRVVEDNEEVVRAIATAVLRTLRSREGVAPKNIVMRAALRQILRRNLPPETVNKLDKILSSLVTEDGDYYHARPDQWDLLEQDVPLLRDVALDVTMRKLTQGPCEWRELYAEVMGATDGLGVPSSGELRKILQGHVFFKGNTVHLKGRLGPLFS